MNLNELRLKALLSLKRPLPSPTDETVTAASSTLLSTPKETETENFQQTEGDREEGELTDYSGSEGSTSPSEKYPGYTEHAPENTGYTTHNDRVEYLQYKHDRSYSYNGPSSKRSKYTWTRSHQNQHQTFYEDSYSYSEESLDNLKDMKSSLLCQLDDNQALLAASEDHEQELMVEIEECRALHRRCESERAKLERKLEKLLKFIMKRETVEDELNRQVGSNNYKKCFVGKMLKESYCRSMKSKFLRSKLYKMYYDTIGIDHASFSFNHIKIDPQMPFCATELINGKCPYRKKTCTFQHIESLRYDNAEQVLNDYKANSNGIDSCSSDPYGLIRKILEEI